MLVGFVTYRGNECTRIVKRERIGFSKINGHINKIGRNATWHLYIGWLFEARKLGCEDWLFEVSL